jgi:hypothetical protein
MTNQNDIHKGQRTLECDKLLHIHISQMHFSISEVIFTFESHECHYISRTISFIMCNKVEAKRRLALGRNEAADGVTTITDGITGVTTVVNNGNDPPSTTAESSNSAGGNKKNNGANTGGKAAFSNGQWTVRYKT